MTIAQRKIELINWITNLDDETFLSKVEEIRENAMSEVPTEIKDLIEISTQTPEKNLIKHTSVKDFKK